MKIRYFRWILIAILLLGIQSSVVHLIKLENITPDLLVIFIVYLGIREGQIPATIFGFALGLTYDFITADMVVGLSAFSKTFCGFIAGYFYNENKVKLILGSYRFILIVILCSFVHNLVYFLIYHRGTEIDLVNSIFYFGIATAFYTSIVSSVLVIAHSRKISV